jgi:hypothetical protein
MSPRMSTDVYLPEGESSRMSQEAEQCEIAASRHDTAADADVWWGTRSADRGVVSAPPRFPRCICAPRLEAPGR